MARMMKAVEVSRAGGPEVLTLVERPTPAPGSGEVLIRIHAAGINGHDLHHRHNGSHPIEPGETDLPGLEVAGVIEACGPGVSGWHVGDKTCALVRGGGYAEYCLARFEHCMPIPPGFSMVEAASLPETCFTVWSNVYVESGLKPGERFLMNGGSSGIGVTAIQIASALGSEVYATAGGAEKCATCESLGAKRAIDYQQEDFAEVLPAATGGKGIDVILDIICGDYIPRDIKVLAQDGRLAVIGTSRGGGVQLDFVQVMRKRLKLTGSLLRPRSIAYKARVGQELRERVWPLYASRRIRPVIDSVYPLAEASRAHERLEARAHTGKLLLQMV
jgi:NADPH2:quinone reductase